MLASRVRQSLVNSWKRVWGGSGEIPPTEGRQRTVPSPRRQYWLLVRLVGYAGLIAVGATTALLAFGWVEPDLEREMAITITLGMVLSVVAWMIALVARPKSTRLLRATDLVLGNVLLTVLALEIATVTWARCFPSPLAWHDTDTLARIDAHRMKPGTRMFGFPINSRGYHDEEFFLRSSRDLVVASIGDSFGIGVVPHAFHFTTVAEERLRSQLAERYERIAIHNISVPSIGLAQYIHLIEVEAAIYEPDLVVLGLFIGNDVIEGSVRRRQIRPYSLQRWLLWRVGARLAVTVFAADSVERLRSVTAPEASELTVPAFVHDPALEVPTLTVAEHLRIQRERLEVTNRESKRIARRFGKVFEVLGYLDAKLDGRLIVLLIPDEFQVDDAQWEQLLADLPTRANYDRTMPQRRILAYCQSRGIRTIDVLPVLRAHVAGGGARPYHLRDTHWNATGNRIAGELLGDAIAAWVRSR